MTDASAIPSSPSAQAQRVVQLMADSLGKRPDELALDRRLVEDLKLDSVDRLSLLMVLEKEYDAEIPDEVLTTFVTVGDVVAYVRDHVLAARRANG